MSKSRHIPISEFYSALQKEYVSYFVRWRIYQKKYAEKYQAYCDGKKEKIESISFRNCLSSIFNSKDSKEKYIKGFFNEWGMPDFKYKDKKSESIMGRWDKFYYFSTGVTVRYFDQATGDMTIGVITENNIDESKVKVKTSTPDNMPEIELAYTQISRVFPDNFFNF